MSVRNHPKPCFQCSLLPGSVGFVADTVPANPRVWVMKQHPQTGEVEQDAEKIETMRAYWERDYLKPAGLSYDDLAVSHVFRCRPKNEPVGKVRKQAENICRQYDAQSADSAGRLRKGGLTDWAPDVFIITFDHLDCIDVPARKLFVRRAFGLAKMLIERAHKPMILMGKEAAQLVYPSLFVTRTRDREAGFKSWVGHYWFGAWPFVAPEEPKKPESGLVNIELVADAAYKRLTHTKWRLNDL